MYQRLCITLNDATMIRCEFAVLWQTVKTALWYNMNTIRIWLYHNFRPSLPPLQKPIDRLHRNRFYSDRLYLDRVYQDQVYLQSMWHVGAVYTGGCSRRCG